MLTIMGDRVRMIFDCDEQLRRAIGIRAAKTGKGKSEVIVEALLSFLSEELDEAERAMQKHAKPKKKPD